LVGGTVPLLQVPTDSSPGFSHEDTNVDNVIGPTDGMTSVFCAATAGVAHSKASTSKPARWRQSFMSLIPEFQ
jgi:hypothetical protein